MNICACRCGCEPWPSAWHSECACAAALCPCIAASRGKLRAARGMVNALRLGFVLSLREVPAGIDDV